ncbi:MAG: response regulator transcription factor [Syntrophothermus sp.]
MGSKILLVDDERDIVEFLQYNLQMAGYDVITAYDGKEALTKLSEKPDLIILDIMMPKMDGFEVCRRIRENKGSWPVPIIFLTAKSSEADEIKGLETGADDFVVKPISPKKLLARIKANMRKNDSSLTKEEKEEIIRTGPLEIDRDKYEITINGEKVFFPKKEFEILYYIAVNPGRVITREAILRDIWGTDVFVVERTIDVHVRKIREKLGEFADMIETIKGVGYRFRNNE